MQEARSGLLHLLSQNVFELAWPSREEVRAVATSLRQEQAQQPEACTFTESWDGFRSTDSVVAWMFTAWKRNELRVLAAPPWWTPAEPLTGDASPLVARGCRWLLPAFATIVAKEKDAPYIELLWVRSTLRRLGIGSLLVTKLLEQHPRVKRVKAVLREAVPFWDKMARAVDVAGAMALHTPQTLDTWRAAAASEVPAAIRLQAAWRRNCQARSAQYAHARRAHEAAMRVAATCIQGSFRQRYALVLTQGLRSDVRRRRAAEMMQRCWVRRHPPAITPLPSERYGCQLTSARVSSPESLPTSSQRCRAAPLLPSPPAKPRTAPVLRPPPAALRAAPSIVRVVPPKPQSPQPPTCASLPPLLHSAATSLQSRAAQRPRCAPAARAATRGAIAEP